MSRAALLYRLQQLDSEEEQGRRRLEEVVAALRDTSVLDRAREADRKAGERVQELSARQRDLELEVRGVKDEAASSERRLYGGGVRNPRELEDLQAKVASLKRLLERREEALLEVMISLEEAQASYDQARSRLRDVEASRAADRAELEAEKERLEARLAEVGREREALLPSIPPDDLDMYRSLRRTKGGVAVAVIQAGACTACGMEVPAGRLGRGREAGFLLCGNCERILVPESP